MNILRHTSFFSLCIIAILSLCGCAKYRAQPLDRLSTCVSNKKEPTIALAYKALNKPECKRYLDRNVLSKGYQPIHVTLSNNTNRSLNFSKANISIQTVSAEEIAQKVHTSTVARATIYGIGGLVLLPVTSILLWPLSIFLWPLEVALLATPAIVDGVGSSHANQKLDEDFLRKELCDQTVNPFNTINGLIFVPREKFDPEFTITLVDTENHDQFTLTTEKPVLKI